MAPRNGQELASALKTALAQNGPVAIRYPRGKTEDSLPEKAYELAIGKGELMREGNDLLILAAGSMVQPALQAHGLLLKKGIRSCVINPRFIKPLDRKMLCHWIKKCQKVLTVEDHVLCGGLGSAVLEMLEEEGELKNVQFKRLGFPGPFTGLGSREEILHLYNLSGEGIAQEALKICQAKEKVHVSER